jgi:hypothetical protein
MCVLQRNKTIKSGSMKAAGEGDMRPAYKLPAKNPQGEKEHLVVLGIDGRKVLELDLEKM